jgi:hypothetical protein
VGGMFERSKRPEHQTLGVQRLAVRSEDYWDFKPEQRVKTIDGVTGVVRHVEDGPFPGSEEYEVELEHGMGGGKYTASQLSPAPITTSAMEQTAAADYPELAEVLVERPDPVLQRVTAAKAAPFGDDDQDDSEDDSSDDDGNDDDQDDDSDGDKDDGKDDEDSDDDGDDAPPWAKKTSALFSRLVVTAATDADFRFHITAAWSDVVAKAKRIRSEGRLRVTMASDGLVFAEVKGDHQVYETGLQRMPGKVAAQSWSCGCKWGAYHWGADDDFSRFAGRMCSHALALQYEAQSRGMFGRDINADEHKPTWVPRKVVVRYDIDADTHRLAPATASLGPDDSVAPLSVVARAAVAAGEDVQELLLALAAAGISTGQGELFDAKPYKVDKQKAVPDREQFGDDENGHRYHVDGKGSRFYPCFNKHCAEGGKHEDGESAERHSTVYTDWSTVHPTLPDTLHRGMAVSLPDDVHKIVHDGHRPTAERAKALSDHLRAGGMGTHWTPSHDQARHYSGITDGQDRDTHVILHAHTPSKRAIETDPDTLADQDVVSMGDHEDAEVPLRHGAKVSLKGISWQHRTDDKWTRHDFDKPVRHTANANAPFGEASGTSYVLPKTPGATAPKKSWENPASAGPLAGADPAGWNRVLPLQAYAGMDDSALFEPGGAEATLHEEPEGALPATDGAVPTDEASDLTPSMTAGLKRQALKDFSLAEQQALINEGEGVRAANLDRLDIKGTHYADLEHVLAAQEDDTTWLA